MNYDESVKLIHVNKGIDIQRMIEVCENFNQSMKAFNLSCEFGNYPSYELLELALGYAKPGQINSIINGAARLVDEDDRARIIESAIDQYDYTELPLVRSLKYGFDISDYGLSRPVKFYKFAPEGSLTKLAAIDKIVEVIEFMFDKPSDCTVWRVKNVTNLKWIDDAKIHLLVKKANEWLSSEKFLNTK